VSGQIEEFVLRNFRGKPSEKAVLLAAADAVEPVDHCMLSIRLPDLIVRSNVSAREFYRCIPILDEERWLQRMSPWRSSSPVRVFHHERFCEHSAKLAECGVTPSPLCPRKQSTVPDLRHARNAWQSGFLPFSRQGFVRDKCEECSGRGYRRIPRPDGLPGQVEIPCAHQVAALVAGSWKPVEHWQLDVWKDDHLLDWLRIKEPKTLRAEQCAFDWDEAKRQTLVEELRRKHPEMFPEPPPTRPSKVLVTSARKTA